MLIVACAKDDIIIFDSDSNNNKTIELFKTIKSKIFDALNNLEGEIYLEPKDFKMKNYEIKEILEPIYKKTQENQEVFVTNDTILNKITERLENIVNSLNNNLRKISVLENHLKVVKLISLKAKMNGNDIKNLIELIDKMANTFTSENFDFDYNLQLDLNFTINIENKEDSYIYNPKSAFITSDKKGLNQKIFKLADKLSTKLENQELDAKKIIDNVLNNNVKSYEQSFSNELNNILKDKNIKIDRSSNMDINREKLSFQLNFGDDINQKNNFVNFIDSKNSTHITVSEEIFSNKKSFFYQFAKFKIENNKIFTKIFDRFTITKWSIEGIDLPKRDLKNIKIYHQKNDIEKSWINFYEILKHYFKQRINKDKLWNDVMIISVSKDLVTREQALGFDKWKMIQTWNQQLKKQISSYKYDSKIDLANGTTKYESRFYYYGEEGVSYYDNHKDQYLINFITFQIFYNQLNYFFEKNDRIIFHFQL